MSWASLNELFWHELYTSFRGIVQAASITTYFNWVCFQGLLNRMRNLNLGPMYSRYLVCISKFIFLENFFWGKAIVNHIFTSILWLQHLPHYFSLLVSNLSIYYTQWNAWCYWNFDKLIANIICGCSPEPFVPTPVFSPEFWVHKVSREGFFS